MGYYISVTNIKFKVKQENKHSALQAIRALKGKETCHDSSGAHFCWVDQKSFMKGG